ncbi:hypothetical protein AGMMS49579_16590 [Spirochaetia bacterium]|nr:hypothetical protein AGMMS49579_16590 [Spirochaetia bacterium]
MKKKRFGFLIMLKKHMEKINVSHFLIRLLLTLIVFALLILFKPSFHIMTGIFDKIDTPDRDFGWGAIIIFYGGVFCLDFLLLSIFGGIIGIETYYLSRINKIEKLNANKILLSIYGVLLLLYFLLWVTLARDM